jgi:hypothetical protein
MSHSAQWQRVVLAGVVIACQPSSVERPAARLSEPSEQRAQRGAGGSEGGAGPVSATVAASGWGAPSAQASGAAEPLPPTYDLAQDLERIEAEARVEFGPRVRVQTAARVFSIAGRASTVRSTAPIVERALAAYYNGRFSVRPRRALSIFLYPSLRPFHAYCRRKWNRPCSTPYGFYLASERRIVMNIGPGVGTLTHELVHPIVEADFGRAPAWLDEGIASLYERFHFYGRDEIGGSKNWRHPRLVAALRSPTEREHATVQTLFGMSDSEFRDARESLHYAMARYLCQWLDARHELWPFYHRWRDRYDEDPTGERAFVEVVGLTPERAQRRWARWVRQL